MATLGEQLVAMRAQMQAEHERIGVIHMGGGELRVRYRVIPLREDRKIGARHNALTDATERDLRVAADTLVMASTGVEAHVGEQVEELPPLGMALAEKLGLEAENDRQVVFMLFPSDRAVLEEWLAHEAWTSEVSKGVDGQLAGNSGAATSAS